MTASASTQPAPRCAATDPLQPIRCNQITACYRLQRSREWVSCGAGDGWGKGIGARRQNCCNYKQRATSYAADNEFLLAQVTDGAREWEQAAGWPPDPLWTESNWPAGQPCLLLYQVTWFHL